MHVFKDLHLASSILTNIMNRVIARGNTLNLQNQEEVLEFFSFFVFLIFPDGSKFCETHCIISSAIM